MRAVRLLLLLVPAALLLLVAGCGGSGTKAPPAASGPHTIAGAGASTIGAGTARFTLTVTGSIGGLDTGASERGSLSFARNLAHIYKLLLSGGTPQELIVDGPIQYANGNVDAAMNDPSVKAWTRLDTRRLTAEQQLANDGELAHVRVPAYLIEGVRTARVIGAGSGGTTHFRGLVYPALLESRVPVALRPSLMAAVRADYIERPFSADFWIDARHHVRRVHVTYATPGGRVTVDATYSGFGARVPLGLPPASGTTDITP
jgi:hypothetical protein